MERPGVKPLPQEGAWVTGFQKYFRSARASLAELEALVAQLQAARSDDASPVLSEAEKTPEAVARYRQRDRLAEAAIFYSALSVEGFLNYYGVVRLGHEHYDSHLERLGLERKLIMLVLICDNICLTPGDDILKPLAQISRFRNELVHPKAAPAGSLRGERLREGWHIVDRPRESVASAERFFASFSELIPSAVYRLDDLDAA